MSANKDHLDQTNVDRDGKGEQDSNVEDINSKDNYNVKKLSSRVNDPSDSDVEIEETNSASASSPVRVETVTESVSLSSIKPLSEFESVDDEKSASSPVRVEMIKDTVVFSPLNGQSSVIHNEQETGIVGESDDKALVITNNPDKESSSDHNMKETESSEKEIPVQVESKESPKKSNEDKSGRVQLLEKTAGLEKKRLVPRGPSEYGFYYNLKHVV